MRNTSVTSLNISGNTSLQRHIAMEYFYPPIMASLTKVNNGLTDTLIYALAISGNNIYAGTLSGYFYLPTMATVGRKLIMV